MHHTVTLTHMGQLRYMLILKWVNYKLLKIYGCSYILVLPVNNVSNFYGLDIRVQTHDQSAISDYYLIYVLISSNHHYVFVERIDYLDLYYPMNSNQHFW